MNKTSHDSETPAVGLQVITACAFIYHNFGHEWKVFLAQRAMTKKFMPGKYELPGGHIDFGEDIEVGLKREIWEEFGKGVIIEAPIHVFTYMNKVKGSHSIEVVYLTQFEDRIENLQVNSEDHANFVWATHEEAVKLYVDQNDEGDLELPAIKKGFARIKRTVSDNN